MKYKYMSQWSGEIQPDLLSAIKETIGFIRYYPFELKMLYWRYRYKGW